MKKLVLAFGILVSALSVGMAMSEEEQNEVLSNIIEQIRQRSGEAEAEERKREERERAYENCLINKDKSACQALIDSGLISVRVCIKEVSRLSCRVTGAIYANAGYYKEAIPYFEKAIALGDNGGYHLLGSAYYGLDDYLNAKKYFEISCNTDNDNRAVSCHNLGIMYSFGQGVKQNRSIAKQYAGKACDLGEEMGCYDYKRYSEEGVQ